MLALSVVGKGQGECGEHRHCNRNNHSENPAKNFGPKSQIVIKVLGTLTLGRRLLHAKCSHRKTAKASIYLRAFDVLECRFSWLRLVSKIHCKFENIAIVVVMGLVVTAVCKAELEHSMEAVDHVVVQLTCIAAL